MRRPPGLAPGAGPLGGPHFAGGAVGPAAYWRPSRRPGVFCSWCRLGSLWAHGCQRRALHHSAASTRLGSGAPRPAGDGTWSPNPLPRSRHPCAETTRPPAGPCAGWTVWGPAGDTGAGRRAEDPRACSLPFGLWPQPGVWKPQRGGLQRRGRGVASPPSPHSASRHPSGLPQAPPSPPEDPALRHLLPPGIWMPADGPTLLPQNTGLAMPPQNHPGLSQRVAVGPWTPPDQLPRPHLTALGWDLVPAPAAAQP